MNANTQAENIYELAKEQIYKAIDRVADEVIKKLKDEGLEEYYNVEITKDLIRKAVEHRIINYLGSDEKYEEFMKSILRHNDFEIISIDVDEENDTVIYIYDKKEKKVKYYQYLEHGYKGRIDENEAIVWTVRNYILYNI